jgi:hypothetical protein
MGQPGASDIQSHSFKNKKAYVKDYMKENLIKSILVKYTYVDHESNMVQ